MFRKNAGPSHKCPDIDVQKHTSVNTTGLLCLTASISKKCCKNDTCICR